LQRLIQRAHTELALHRRRDFPTEHVARGKNTVLPYFPCI
jgi:hypothetical protein